MSVFEPALITLFAGPLATDAVYKTGSEPDKAIRVITMRPDEEIDVMGISVKQVSKVFDVLQAEVPEPKKGDTITEGGTVYRVSHKICPDADRLLWRLFA